MAYAKTEHSKKLRVKGAAAWNKKQLADGVAKRMTLQLPADIADEFDAICAELGLSRPQALKRLCEAWRGK
ncbi:hypothetical protein A1D23_09475 [Chelonobacter oris]|uniref:ribbon-helix-helix protein, CopG family n=1 Tax=Chelonobacter oris TaxID=505317 RepID=UPI00244AD327|nr:ribbon-helix-helix protein, CopG family [Chelonobacter oris]MDH3000649.1 hypothetical protein [Chelonobacter oris]